MRKEEFSTLPKLVQQYLVYIEAIKGHSEKSVLEYASDLRTFFRYIVKLKGLYSFDTEDEKIDLSPIDLNFIQSVNLEDAYQFMIYCKQRNYTCKTCNMHQKILCLFDRQFRIA